MALGYIEPISHVIKVGVPSSSEQTAASRLYELKVSEGDNVESGDILAILDSVPRLKAAIAEAKSTLELRRSQLARTEVNAQATISQQKEIVARREAGMLAAQRELNRYEVLFPMGAVSKQALDDKQLAFQVAQRDLGEARVALDKALAVDSSKLLFDIRIAKNEVIQAEKVLERNEIALEASYVRAPSSGRILRILVRPGEQVPSGGALLELADISRMGIRIEVDQADVARIWQGQVVHCLGINKSDNLVGRVIRIADDVKKQTIFESDAAARVDARSVEVWAELDTESAIRAAKQINAQVRARFDSYPVAKQ